MATKGKINVDFTMRYIGALRANRIVANPNRYSTINYKDIVTYAARAAHVPESSIEVAMDALYDALSYFVLNGHNVKIDGLGTFFFGINAYAEEQIENAGADAIHRLKIGYLPEKDLREAMNNVAVTTTYTNPGNLAVDPTVPAHIESISSMLSQTAKDMKAMSFGSVQIVPENGLYIRVTGTRLDRITSAAADVNIYGSAGEEGYQIDLKAATIQIVAQNAKNLILKVNYPEFEKPEDVDTVTVYIDKLTLSGNSGVVLFRYYSSPEGGSSIEQMSVVSTSKGVGTLTSLKGGLTAIPQGETYRMFITGANLMLYKMNFAAMFDTTKMRVDEVIEASDSRVRYTFTPLEESIPYGGGERSFVSVGQMIFNNSSSGSGSDPVVASLTANGISVANGGSSTVQAGQSYNFVFAGANLGGLHQSDLVVPQGATISNFNAAASQVRFTLTIGEVGGNIGINYNGASLFSVAVTIPTNIDAAVTSIEGVSNNGNVSVDISNDNLNASVEIVGTGLNSLTPNNIVFAGATVELNTGSATSRTATLTFAQAPQSGPLRVQIDGTTIFTVNVNWNYMF